MVVLDTSTLIFWTLDPSSLSLKATITIDEAEQLVISSISIWEIGVKVKRNRLEIPLDIHDFAEQLQYLERLEILSVGVQTWLDNLSLDWEHRDLADRTIVATAIRLDCPLVTSDGRIANFYPNTIW